MELPARDIEGPRYLVVGEVDEQVIAVIWTPRENETVRRIISARPASKKERKHYRDGGSQKEE